MNKNTSDLFQDNKAEDMKFNADTINNLIASLRVEENKLSVDEFINLRKNGPFVSYTKEDVDLALKNTLYRVSIYNENEIVGMARVVGDGRIAFFIKDVVVNEKYKGMKIGKELMKNVFNYIERNASMNAYIGLMAVKGTEGFYEKLGFIQRPNEDYGAGMIMYYKGGKIYEENSSLR